MICRGMFPQFRGTRYIPSVRDLVRKSPWYFALAALAAIALRLFFILRFPAVTDDSRVYANIAKTWLDHGIYGITTATGIVPTYIRLPGYPAFLAAVFSVFGRDHFRAVLLIQLVVDVGTCFVVADLTRRLLGERAAKAAFLLTAICPFLANYAGAALTETLEVFFTAAALDFAIMGLAQETHNRLRPWIFCGLALAANILLRPDGGLLLVAIELYLIVSLARAKPLQAKVRTFAAACVVAAVTLAPLVPWTLRNLRTLHRFQPLAPRYANAPEDFVPLGFNRWVKTWMANYVSVEEIYWSEPGEKIDSAKLPARAFDSLAQKQLTEDLLAAYNEDTEVGPELDAQFADLAQQRVRESRLRYYFRLPALRIADMWMRPRTELLPADPRWWEFTDDTKWLALSVGLGAVNLIYVVLAAAGFFRGTRVQPLGLLVVFLLVRSLFLGTLENPEARYTLECYPVVILFASVFLASLWPKTSVS